ncbi:hypothetical protein FAGAP_5379 [Fusarium agapanthi]|uniref:Uncharacterized protein n=1 Tax=Fusarium agapanthi TaxID=1803897 RepID=A0A9P5BB84_9HYPO|nr:hypothetical protein FAGAP_5379 [Fusarium agapanthi]
MSLSAKIKDILHSDESKDTTTETSHHPPGSFPTEEMEPSETHEGYSKGYEHNKLHKAEDPRGHAHKDSGVGFTESNDPTSYKPSNEPISERRDDPLDRTTDTTTTAGATTAGATTAGTTTAGTTTAGTTTAGTTGTTAAGGLGDTSKIPATEGATGAAAPSTQDHPYWGDLPSGGVHNTVIGHGSPEDENARHRAVHFGDTEPTRTAGTLESATFLHRNDRNTTSSATNPTDAQRTTQENPSQTSGSRFTEGLAGAGTAGAGALGVHELSKRRHDDDTQTPSKVDQTTDETHDEHKGRSFPLLGKDHKDKETHHKEEKPKEHKESKLGALFHRKDKTETEAKAEQEADQEKYGHSKPALAAAGAAWGANTAGRGHDDKTQRDVTDPSGTRGATQYPASGLDSTRDYSTQPTGTTQQQDSSHRGAGLATGAAAGVGAGALASHYAQRSDNDRTGTAGTGYDPQSYDPSSTSTRDPTSQTYQKQGSHGDHSLAKGTAAGLGAGTLASHSGQHSSSNQPSTLGSSSAYGAQPDQPANYSHRDPVGQTSQHDSHRGAGLAAGTAAGLGAGALASRSGREHETTGQHTGIDSNRDLESQGNQSAYSSTIPTSQYEQHDSHRGAGLAAGTAAGLGAGALASRSGRDHETTGHSGLDSSRGLSSQTTEPGYSSTNPTSQHQQDNSHHGAGLATGAAAGLGAGALASRSGHHSEQPTGLDSSRGLESQTSQPTSTSTRDTTSQFYQQEGSHRGAGLATGDAAGLGAGALASHESNKRDEDRYLSNDGSRTAHTGATGTGAGLGTSYHEPSRQSEHSQRSTGSHHSTLAENANAGKYNTLASGTPSGIAYDDDLSTNRSSQQPASEKKDGHFGAKAAGLGAAAAGAGTAAALSRNKDEKPVEDKIREEFVAERKLDQTESHRPTTGAVAPQVGTNKPVIHKCQKCGEDNDISKYFTSNSGKI